jgi:hypothetical protein
MHSRHRKTLAAIFSNPAPKTLVWADIESLLSAVGCEVIEGDGSRVRFIRDAKIFLTKLGIEP